MAIGTYIIGAVMVAVAFILTHIVLRHFRSVSDERRLRMINRLGLEPRQLQPVESEVRSRCQRCPAEDLCERWLAGKVDSENGFCPNAQTFARLKTT